MNSLYALPILLMLSAAAVAQDPQNKPAIQAVSSAKSAALPSDIYPDSMARLPVVKREELSDLGKKLYDNIVGGQARSIAGLQGPLGLWLYSPRYAEHALPLNYYLRYETSLGRPLTELAILVTARELDNQFEWTSHEPVAIKEGLSPAAINIVKHRKSISGLSEKEALIITFGRELFGKRKVSSTTFAHALKVFGKQGVMDLTGLMGDYSAVAAALNAFDVQLRAGQKPLLPLP
ncbi:MAG: hypothetical protein HYX72_10175 [Acidobacteria bacterium]|nr:hypothetical protein [Acidobacteriota bacterium]